MEPATAALRLLHRRRRWLLLAAAATATGYGAYRVYHHPSVARKRQSLARLAAALISVSDAVSSSSESLHLLSSDLNSFLRSDSNDLPRSLNQISKIATSDAFFASLSRVSESLTAGIVRGLRSTNGDAEASFSDGAMDKLFSGPGTGFASVVVGSFARNLVLAFFTKERSTDTTTITTTTPSYQSINPNWMNLICDDRCRDLIAHCLERFVSTMVAVYLDKTMHINIYNDIFAGLTNPEHEAGMKDLLVTVCGCTVETLVRASHQVITTDINSGSSSESGFPNGGLLCHVSNTLASPDNRKLVLDVTGRVTSETVRSFLEFMWWKCRQGAGKTAGVVQEEVVKKGLHLVRYVASKYMVILTICLAFCMHVFMGARVLSTV